MNYHKPSEDDVRRLEMNKRKSILVQTLHELQVMVRGSSEEDLRQWEEKIASLKI